MPLATDYEGIEDKKIVLMDPNAKAMEMPFPAMVMRSVRLGNGLATTTKQFKESNRYGGQKQENEDLYRIFQEKSCDIEEKAE